MKFTAVAFAALATLATASPHPPPPPPHGCKPATYSCLPHDNGWQVCSTAGQWVFAGNCPPKTICKFDKENGSPYCVPPGFTIP
ncbi:SSCRP protein [Trichoderma parareesei]|uniref:SSCRP protein n=1 Tax=Trichoderma parareesei TaxID=858221 RepID=A0A2H2ZXG7_TRIPA|nr:SSCRP protein [Trichoderma parareesei]